MARTRKTTSGRNASKKTKKKSSRSKAAPTGKSAARRKASARSAGSASTRARGAKAGAAGASGASKGRAAAGKGARPKASAAGRTKKSSSRTAKGRAASGRARGAGPRRSRHSPARTRATAATLFAEGVERAMQGYLFDAIALFNDAVAAAPKGELADDALFNVGAAYLRMRLVNDAEETFTELIERYPEATIDSVSGGNEHGRTMAKALLGRMQARLAQGRIDDARADRDALRQYGDSWVIDPSGTRKTFHDLAVAVMP